MSISTFPRENSLDNEHLRESPFPTSDYNQLPSIAVMEGVAADYARAHTVLLRMIASRGLSNIFSLHLIHRHFDLPLGRIMVYETVKGKAHSDFVLCSPRLPQDCPDARGLYFKAVPGEGMVAFEFTTEKGANLSAHEDFVAEFYSVLLEQGVQDIFALTALPLCSQGETLTEFEMREILSTALVSDDTWMPKHEMATSTTTDWSATTDYLEPFDESVPGVVQLKCTTTKSDSHFNVTCSMTRNGAHYQKKKGGPGSGVAPSDTYFMINGQTSHEGTEPHAIISHAFQLVAAR